MARGLLFLFFLSAMPAQADPAARFCDPVTNVCFCTGGWDGAECIAMAPLCEPGAWRACSADGAVCSCTAQNWAYGAHRGTDWAGPGAATGGPGAQTDKPRSSGFVQTFGHHLTAHFTGHAHQILGMNLGAHRFRSRLRRCRG